MTTIQTTPRNVSPTVIAALVLTAIEHLKTMDLDHPTATQVLNAADVSRSRAYELKGCIEAMLGKISRPPGRPKTPEPEDTTGATDKVTKQLLDYVCRHPGCFVTGPERSRYTDGLRRFVIDLLEQHSDMTLEAFATASHIPPGTIKDWLRGGAQGLEPKKGTPAPPADRPRNLQIETILAEWQRWQGDFVPFCNHVQLHCRIPFGRTIIARILEAHGVRLRARRPGRSPDELALRGSFTTFFPHAQWVGDGTLVPVMVNGQLFPFNVEMNVDAYSGAFVGADVSMVEDSTAVIKTFRDAINASGAQPIALLLDNKPSNHTDQVTDELDETMLIRSTPFRPQNKAHIEGGFGLLKPSIKGLELGGNSPQDLAASFLKNLVITWARTINYKPRTDRGGKSRKDLLGEQPTPEQVQQAHEALTELLHKQQQARQTLAARQNPIVREAIAQAYVRLELQDPDGHILTATARYPIDAVLEAIAIFEGKTRAGTLPDNADARYMLGIAHNIANEREEWEISMALWNERVAARDMIAMRMNQERDDIKCRCLQHDQLVSTFVDKALETESRIERFFWLAAAGGTIADQDDPHNFKRAARRITATHAVPHRERVAAIRFLAERVVPLR